MLNPVQEYAKARAMPIPALVAVLQGQSDMVSLGVAHAALKEKTEAEVAKKGADAAAMAQAPKVIDKDLAMAQGLAAMPADIDVPMGGIVGQDGQITDMAAGGGIVAFQAGGRPLMSTQRPGPGVTFSQAFPNAAPAAAPATRGFMDYVKGAGRGLGRFLPGFSMATATDNLNVGEEDQLEVYRTLLGLGYTEDDVRNMPADMRKQIVDTVKQSQAQQAQQTQQAPQVQPEGQGQQIQGQGQQAPGGIAALPRAQQTSYSDLMTQARDMAAGAMSDAEPTKTAKQFMDDYRTLLDEAGFNFDLVKEEIANVRAEKEALKGSKKEAANLRLIEAGLGILGGESPYAFVNIGKGASPALKGLAEDLKDIQKESRALDKERRQLMLMQNEIAAGKARYGLDAVSKQQERITQRENAIANREVNIFTALTSADTQRYVADTSRAVAQSQRENTVEATRRKDALDLARRQVQAAMQRDPRLGMDTAKQEELLNQYFTENYKRLSEGPAAEQPPSGLPSQSAIRAEMARRGMK
jgi:hypothetical protein